MDMSKRVLVVDDDPTIRNLVAEVLRDEGYDTVSACNGAEALAEVRSRRPDAVFLDLMMPVMDGREFLRAIRALPNLIDLPVVVMSAAHNAADICSRLGAQACIPKPFDMDVLVSTADRLS